MQLKSMREWWRRLTGHSRHNSVPTERMEIENVELRFLGEQDGPVESDLKRALSHLFRERNTVLRAYLARVQYGHSVNLSVALCVAFNSPYVIDDTVNAAAELFHETFAKGQMLEIIPVNAQLERNLARVCNPFYASKK
jgi:hypothetical protein